MDGVAYKAQRRFDRAKAHMAVHPPGHSRGVELTAGLALITDSIAHQRFINAASLSVLLQHFQPKDIVLVAVLSVAHRKFQRCLPPHHHRRAGDAVML